MPRPYHSVIIPAKVDEVWSIIRDFGNLADWHPAITESRLARGCSGGEVSAQRKFVLADGGAHVTEQIMALDDRFHTLVFAVVDGPFLVKDYIATIRLSPIGDAGQTFAEWWAEFDAGLSAGEELAQAVKDTFFIKGLGALKERFS